MFSILIFLLLIIECKKHRKIDSKFQRYKDYKRSKYLFLQEDPLFKDLAPPDTSSVDSLQNLDSSNNVVEANSVTNLGESSSYANEGVPPPSTSSTSDMTSVKTSNEPTNIIDGVSSSGSLSSGGEVVEADSVDSSSKLVPIKTTSSSDGSVSDSAVVKPSTPLITPNKEISFEDASISDNGVQESLGINVAQPKLNKEKMLNTNPLVTPISTTTTTSGSFESPTHTTEKVLVDSTLSGSDQPNKIIESSSSSSSLPDTSISENKKLLLEGFSASSTPEKSVSTISTTESTSEFKNPSTVSTTTESSSTPINEKIQPIVEQTQPINEKTQPIVEQTQPINEKTQPIALPENTFESKPIADKPSTKPVTAITDKVTPSNEAQASSQKAPSSTENISDICSKCPCKECNNIEINIPLICLKCHECQNCVQQEAPFFGTNSHSNSLPSTEKMINDGTCMNSKIIDQCCNTFLANIDEIPPCNVFNTDNCHVANQHLHDSKNMEYMIYLETKELYDEQFAPKETEKANQLRDKINNFFLRVYADNDFFLDVFCIKFSNANGHVLAKILVRFSKEVKGNIHLLYKAIMCDCGCYLFKSSSLKIDNANQTDVAECCPKNCRYESDECKNPRTSNCDRSCCSIPSNTIISPVKVMTTPITPVQQSLPYFYNQFSSMPYHMPSFSPVSNSNPLMNFKNNVICDPSCYTYCSPMCPSTCCGTRNFNFKRSNINQKPTKRALVNFFQREPSI